jgi:hypothetical protein
VFAASGDVFYILSFYLMTLRTMSRFSWGGRVVVDKKKLTNQLIAFVFNKTNLTKLLLLGWQSKGEFY